MSLYADLKTIVDRLIGQFGFQVTVTRATGTFDLVEGTETGTPTVETHTAVSSKHAGQLVSDVRMIGNASILTTDVALLFKPDALITDADKITYDGDVWSILGIGWIQPGGTKLLQKVWLRR